LKNKLKEIDQFLIQERDGVHTASLSEKVIFSFRKIE
jgi:hypothetical protein